MKIKKNTPVYILPLVLLLILTGCDLNITDPNTATDEEVLNSREGIIALTTGMQGYAKTTALQAVVRTSAVSTREMAINTTFANLIELEQGGVTLPEENASILQLWSRLNRLSAMASDLIENAGNVALADDEISEILALAHYYRAWALTYLAAHFEQAPIENNPEGNAIFVDRGTVLGEAIRLLEDAAELIGNQSPSTVFTLPGFDIPNSIQALLARAYLMNGQFDDAITAANQVDISVASVFSFEGTTRNPVYDDVFVSEAFAARANLGVTFLEDDDLRPAFFIDTQSSGNSTPNNLPIADLIGFFDGPAASIPVFRPGEMALIRAEAFARTSRPNEAVAEINAVRTKLPADDIFGIGAGLSAYSGATDENSLLNEIFHQRAIELYLSGLRMEDARRLGRPEVPTNPDLNAERNRVFYPYPQQERLANPNTPESPTI